MIIDTKLVRNNTDGVRLVKNANVQRRIPSKMKAEVVNKWKTEPDINTMCIGRCGVVVSRLAAALGGWKRGTSLSIKLDYLDMVIK
jgi:hypothetical protein